LIFPPLLREVQWGAGIAEMERRARRIAPRVQREGGELTAYVNGNQAWLGFQFVADRLVEVRERHNNPNRAPPFVGGFLRSIVSQHGEPDSVEENSGGCTAVWTVDGGTLTALWRDSEWFMDVFYRPAPATQEALSGADERIGEWCDSEWPATVTLTRGNGEALSLSLQFDSGGRATRSIVLRNNAYYDTESSFGEHYRVGPGGELRIFDNDGFVRSARPGRCAS